MKKRLLLIPAALLLVGCSFMPNEAVVAHAEMVESQVSETSEPQPEPASSQSTSKPSAIDSIVIDGKTIEQWKAELRDEQTRTGALVGLIVFLGTGSLFVLRWLNERGLLKKNRLAAEELQSLVLKQKEEAVAQAKEYKEVAEGLAEQAKQMKAVLSDSTKSAEEIRRILDVILTTDPTLVTAGAYEKAVKALEKKNGATQD